jgi:hypothetical protein
MGTRFKEGVVAPSILIQHVMGAGTALPRIVMGMEAVQARHFPEMDVVITSVCDGQHIAGSKHYTGNAIDFRSAGWPVDIRKIVIKDLKTELGKDYDVVDEVTHIHIEYDPK